MSVRLDPASRPAAAAALTAALAVAGAAALFALLPFGQALATAAFWCLVLVVVRSDLDSLTIPDEASLGILGIGLVRAVLDTEAVPAAAVTAAFFCGMGAFAVFWALAALYRRWRGVDGIGFGDVKLAGALGVWLDPVAQAAALQLAALAALGLIVAARAAGRPVSRGAAVPFGAFLAPAAFAVHLAGALGPAIPEVWP